MQLVLLYLITHAVLCTFITHIAIFGKILCNVIEVCQCVLMFCSKLLIQLQEDVILGDLLHQKMFIESMCCNSYNIQFCETLLWVNNKQQDSLYTEETLASYRRHQHQTTVRMLQLFWTGHHQLLLSNLKFS